MKISKKSWHYRFNSNFTEDYKFRNMTLCRYFWETVSNFLCCVFLLGVLGLVLTTICSIAICFYYAVLILLGITTFEANPISADGFVGGGILFLFALIMLFGKLRQNLSNKRQNKEPGLFKSYFKAKKDKFCPNVEIVD